MAELFTLASNLLSTIASPQFQMEYKRLSLTDDINELAKMIEKIQPRLIDVEKKRLDSLAVEVWIRSLKGVLYEADDLFDDDYLLQKHISTDNSRILTKVRAFSSKLTPGSSIATKVKSIRERLLDISVDMANFNFAISAEEQPANTRRVDSGSFVHPKDVIGREQDKKAILEMILDESNDGDLVKVIAIVGRGGMGKTALSQLIYNDKAVALNFEQRWFACLSKPYNERQVLRKIFQSITGENFTDFAVTHLNSKIRDSVKDTKFLLVLDDVWDEDPARWHDRMSLFDGCTKGSRIIVTTGSPDVPKAFYASKTYALHGLSDESSWELFKRVAFTPEQEYDPRWTVLGREIVKACANVPLDILSVASLLCTKATFQEWESVDKELTEHYDYDRITTALELSYDHLPSSMKPCFAYCSLFPQDSEFEIKKLVYLWIAQGYIQPGLEGETIEQVGYSYFMDLLMRGLFQDAEVDEYGQVVTCRMHDLVHEIAQEVAGEDIILLTSQRFVHVINGLTRHVGVDFEMDHLGESLESLIDNKRLRSLVLMNGDSCSIALDQLFTNLKLLRALSLSDLGIVNVSGSVGELKHLRYLDLSHNNFVGLPDSMTNLVNLLTLDIEGCYNLKQLPDNFRKLTNLRCLNNTYCYQLKHMPPGIGELACLHYLSSFKVGIATQGVQWSGLDALDGLTQLTGELLIDFETGIEDWYGDESWQLPVSPQRLHIWEYPGRRIPRWDSERTNNLSILELESCSEVRYLPPLRSLPRLRILSLRGLKELEYMEEDEIEVRDSCASIAESSAALFFPRLEQLELRDVPKLKGWSKRFSVHQEEHSLLYFSLLSKLTIINSPKLKTIPLSPNVRKLELYSMDSKLVQQLLSPCSNSPSSLEDLSITECQGPLDFSGEALASLRSFYGDRCSSLETLHLLSPNVFTVVIKRCQELKSLEVESPLRSLKIERCNRLKNLHIAPHGVLEELFISDCPELKLWESQDERYTLDSPTSKASLPIQFPLHRRFLSIDATHVTGKKTYMLAAEALEITHIANPWNWRWSTPSLSTPSLKVAELIKDWWLNIAGKVKEEWLSPAINYKAYFVYKLNPDAQGFKDNPVEIVLSTISKTCYLDPSTAASITPEGTRVTPKTRADGWLEIEMGSFNVGNSGAVIDLIVKDYDVTTVKTGLCVLGFMMRPLD